MKSPQRKTYPNPLNFRVAPETLKRMEKIAKQLSAKWNIEITVRKVAEMCVNAELPNLERKYGIKSPEEKQRERSLEPKNVNQVTDTPAEPAHYKLESHGDVQFGKDGE